MFCPNFNKQTTTLYVRNIPQEVDESLLKSIFSSNGLGPIRKIKKLKDFAFVHYIMKEDAEKALNELNGINLSGRILQVTWAKPRVQAIEGSGNVQKKSKIRKDIEEWNVSQECPKHVMPPAFIPTVSSLHHTPIQMLEYVCLESGFGEPYYLIYQSASSEILKTFTSKVFIPYLPSWENGFVSGGGFLSAFEAKCFAALKALRNIGFSDNEFHFPGDQFIPALKFPSCPSIASIPNSCMPIGLNIGQESRHHHELERTSSSYSDLWNFQKGDDIVSSKKSDSVSSCDLLAAAIVAYREMQACSSKQK
ncbi:unnamed protein product [Larinioides sclopetarius]|uniref:RRM domain-containing protein n=1 Tax=Larinioides sclopetarius TaxID=280406 RepID=A0AAV2BM64_9ARAC